MLILCKYKTNFTVRLSAIWDRLPSSRLMGMCCWMGSYFHDWIDYYGVVFLEE